MRTIIVLTKDDSIEVFTALTKICNIHKEFKYNYIKTLKFPFTYKGYKFQKLNLN